MTPDPALRWSTPLLAKLRAQIEQHGPLCVRDYMQTCLYDDQHGYYKTATVLGRHGDFITAPEISQVFGELIGLWCAAVWQMMSSPKSIALVELGAGNGTLMKDALRALKLVPDLYSHANIFIVETHPALRQKQADLLSSEAHRITWVDSLADIPAQPTLIIANEFLDCLPIEQFIAASDSAQHWQKRVIGFDDAGTLQFMSQQKPPSASQLDDETVLTLNQTFASPQPDAIAEVRNFRDGGLENLANRFIKSNSKYCPCAALFLDYGHREPALGDTLQAVRNHTFEHPLTSPGEADLSAHVDFASFAGFMQRLGFQVDGPVSQGTFLGRLGIVQRAHALIGHNPSSQGEIESAIARLVSPTGMGGRFHAIAVRTPGLAPLPGLEPEPVA